MPVALRERNLKAILGITFKYEDNPHCTLVICLLIIADSLTKHGFLRSYRLYDLVWVYVSSTPALVIKVMDKFAI